MMSGFVNQWKCLPGEWISWSPDEATRDAMRKAPDLGVDTSFIQADHLRSGVEGEACTRRLVFTTFTIHDTFDEDVIRSVFNAFVRSHESFHTAFPVSDHLRPEGRTLAPEQIELTVSATSNDHPGVTVKEHLMEHVPGLEDWAAFEFAVTGIEYAGEDADDPHFEVVIAADHMFTDGVSQAITFFEILSRYSAAREGVPYSGAPVRPYPEFCAEQRALVDTLTPEHPAVRQWQEVVDRAGGMPQFPLPLGLEPEESAPGRILVHTSFVDADKTTRFAKAAKQAGANMGSALLAVLGQVHCELSGEELFTMLVPRSDRSASGDAMAVGWYVTLVPVQFNARGSFEQVVANAHEAMNAAKQLERVPVFPVIDLLADDPSFPVKHGFAAPMLSYVDVSRVPGAELARQHNFSVYANATPSREVFTWINRDDSGLDFNATHPDTEEAIAAVDAVFQGLRDKIVDVATWNVDSPLAGQPEAVPSLV
ncbi:condensation domain-containing protein [Gordonia zhaorongruii]|uniref:condensation domain-containing protein n=1 Tax=Gordonia zhaorongruii TaxID=2597659 RepID=UPI0010438C13|nr:condensation domain-containing protein [Gordonia zhaorongruii]